MCWKISCLWLYFSRFLNLERSLLETYKNELDTNLTNYSFDPISIVFTDPNNDQCKINSEIILNFDHIENENCLKQIEKQIENIKESFKID
jgi:hypothetical protein